MSNVTMYVLESNFEEPVLVITESPLQVCILQILKGCKIYIGKYNLEVVETHLKVMLYLFLGIQYNFF